MNKKMKIVYFIMFVITLLVAHLLLPFNINNAQAKPQCFDGIDNDSDSSIDSADPECTCEVDDDESVVGDPVYYISYDQDVLPTITDVYVTSSCGTGLAQLCSNFNGDPTGCPSKWVCTADNTSAPCYVGLERTQADACNAYDGTIHTVCSTPYEACGCTCPGGGGGGGSGGGSGSGLSTAKPISDVLRDATSWLLTVASIISILVVVIGGIIYVSSSGKPETAKTAKNIVSGGILGLIISGLAYSIIKVIDTVL